MKKLILLFLLLIFCFVKISIAQHAKIDSLKTLLTRSLADTSKVSALNNLSVYYIYINPDSTHYFAAEALKLAEKINHPEGILRAHSNLGIAYTILGDFPKATEFITKSLSLAVKQKNKIAEVNAINMLGQIELRKGNLDSALHYDSLAIAGYEKLGDKIRLSGVYNNMAIALMEKGNNVEAIKALHKSLEIDEAMGDKETVAGDYNNIASVYDQIKDYKSALNYFLKSIESYEQTDNKTGLAIAYDNAGVSYQTLKEYKAALLYLNKSIEVKSKMNDSDGIAVSYNHMGLVYHDLDSNAKAMEYYVFAKRIYERSADNIEHLVTLHGNMADIYIEQKNYPAAISIAFAGLNLTPPSAFPEARRSLNMNLATAYEGEKDFRNAMVYYKISSGLKDSILDSEKTRQVMELQTQYETEKKEKEILALTKDKEIQSIEIKKQKLVKNAFIGGLALVLLLTFFGYRVYRSRQMLQLEQIRNNISADLHDDIGSTLNSISIYSEVAKQKDERQNEALEMIGDSTRKIVDTMSDIVWTINPDNDSFEKIIFRMKSLAHNLFRAKKIEYTFHADESLNEKKLSLTERRNFYLIFKEAVNNLVKYSEATRASITLTGEEDRIRLHIEDNGIGFDLAQENTGNGLKNMKRRADEMHARLKIESGKGNGTQIELILSV